MPNWLQDISRLNPPQLRGRWHSDADALGRNQFLWPGLDFALLLAITFVLVALAGRLYPHLVT